MNKMKIFIYELTELQFASQRMSHSQCQSAKKFVRI